jgi:hypothetical protein
MSTRSAYDLDAAGWSVRAGEASVQCQQCRVERFSQRDVERVPSAHRIAQLPHPVQEPPVAEAFTGSVAQVGNGLPGGGAV